jgi:hypothetical protein
MLVLQPLRREITQIQHGQRSSTHRIDIAKRICRGHLPKQERIIDDRRNIVGRLHQGRIFRQPVYPSIVVRLSADNHILIPWDVQFMEHVR